MIRVAIVDDHPVVRRGLRDMLAAAPEITVVGDVGSADEVVPLVQTYPCDVVLLDLSLPGRGGLHVLADVHRIQPTLRVLVVSTHSETQYAVRAIRAGAAGYIEKSASPEELISAVRQVNATGRYISSVVGAALANYARHGAAKTGLDSLSAREHEVLSLIAAGRTSSEIAETLALSIKTVSTYRTRIMDKLGMKSVAELIRYAIHEGLGSEPL